MEEEKFQIHLMQMDQSSKYSKLESSKGLLGVDAQLAQNKNPDILSQSSNEEISL